MENHIIRVNGKKLKVDDIKPTFAIQDSSASGRSESLDMFREILGGINKFVCPIAVATGEQLEFLRKLSRTPTGTIDIYNSMQGRRRTMKVEIKLETWDTFYINGEEYAKDITISFTQSGKDVI